MSDPSAGEIGGIFAGVVALLALIGGGIKFLIAWGDGRRAAEDERLKARDEDLTDRERRFSEEQAAYYSGIEAQLRALLAWKSRMEAEHSALRSGYQLIASALRLVDPENVALRMADELLRSAFLPDPITPPDMEQMLGDIDFAKNN